MTEQGEPAQTPPADPTPPGDPTPPSYTSSQGAGVPAVPAAPSPAPPSYTTSQAAGKPAAPAQAPPSDTSSQASVPAGPARPSRRPSWLSLPSVGIGVVAGLVVGVVIGLMIPSGGSDDPEDDLAASVDATEDEGATQQSGPTLLVQALDECRISGSLYAAIGDDGYSLDLDGDGQESSGLSYDHLLCVLDELDVPDSVISRMESTRALDGRQEADWDDITASWSYHPDDGLDVLLELEEAG